jgi:subtilase family serine protease
MEFWTTEAVGTLHSRVSRATGLALAALLALGTAHAQGSILATRHIREVVQSGAVTAIADLPPDQTLDLDLILPLRDPRGLDRFLAQVYDPASETYRQFLTVREFAERFGPSHADFEAVVAFATAAGLSVTGESRDGMDVQVRGPVSAIERSLHVRIQLYRHPTEGRLFYAPDREPTPDLHVRLWHISGLDNYSIPHPLFADRLKDLAARGLNPESSVPLAVTGSGPGNSFLGSDMRAAYYGGTTLTGVGQNLGLLEFAGTNLADLKTYFKNTGEANSVPISVISVDRTSTSCNHSAGCDDTEQTLDMTQALGMAPGLASLVMYVGSSDTALLGALTTHRPLPTTIGCSWYWGPVDPQTLNPYFKRMAAQGQNFFAASGDSGTWSGSNEVWPAESAFVVSVGGTDLVTSGAAGPWKSETAWINGGGGISPAGIPIPSWQKLAGVVTVANQGSRTFRNGPDVSANADYSFYTCANQRACLANRYGGTSFAAPMWAAYIALVNQQLTEQGKSTIGFINPLIYAKNVTASYATGFHDITKGANIYNSAVKGFDLLTGWGSPKVGLIGELAP